MNQATENALAAQKAADKEYSDSYNDSATALETGVAPPSKTSESEPTSPSMPANSGYASPDVMSANTASNAVEVGRPMAPANVVATPIEPMKTMSFRETFAARRKAGDATFEWNGKKYTTELKKTGTTPTNTPTTALRPAAPASMPASMPASKPYLEPFESTAPLSTPSPPMPMATASQALGEKYMTIQKAINALPANTDARARTGLNANLALAKADYEAAAKAEKS